MRIKTRSVYNSLDIFSTLNMSVVPTRTDLSEVCYFLYTTNVAVVISRVYKQETTFQV